MGREGAVLIIQERLKDLRGERGLTLGQLAAQIGPSKSALDIYETEDLRDIGHYALITLSSVATQPLLP